MICQATLKNICRESLSLIENYKQAAEDKTQIWDCHHRDEIKILPSGIKVIRSRQELIENNRYFQCPANELIFLKRNEHIKLHSKNQQVEKRNKISQTLKGHPVSQSTKEKLSAKNKGQKRGKRSEEWCQKISIARKGQPSKMKGVPRSEETKMKISQTLKLKRKMLEVNCAW